MRLYSTGGAEDDVDDGEPMVVPAGDRNLELRLFAALCGLRCPSLEFLLCFGDFEGGSLIFADMLCIQAVDFFGLGLGVLLDFCLSILFVESSTKVSVSLAAD